MTTALVLLLVNAVLGAADTLWYHEFKARLPERIESTATELRLHAARDAIYVFLYGALAWLQPVGALGVLVTIGLAAEVVVTMVDFVVEDRDRPAIGGISGGERVLHSVMAIVYGAMLAFLVPVLVDGLVTGFGPAGNGVLSVTRHDAPTWLSLAASVAAAGIAVSGLRDWLAVRRVDPVSQWIPRPTST